MSMTDEIKKVVAEGLEDESVDNVSEVSEEVEEEVEVTSEESLDEMDHGKKKKGMKMKGRRCVSFTRHP